MHLVDMFGDDYVLTFFMIYNVFAFQNLDKIKIMLKRKRGFVADN